ncbi:hypothetical protein [Ectobacillus ponti]|uniref:Uncharacterized protein n=1 Tax=Ectobacillus ponti TaxID=2961894 RepID=A0AA42BQG1_9BACI|nr:hypothetical protein [Ectobacillus ponti]MCP8969852.1 hypothetical protein [Ectobacillus ponti]
MEKPNYYDGSGKLPETMLAALANASKTEVKEWPAAPSIQNPEQKPNYYDGSGTILYK